LLAGCSPRLAKPQPLPPPPAVIDDPIPAFKPVDPVLTNPITEPPPPASLCSYLGQPEVCVLDALLWIENWRGQLGLANDDRSTTATVTAPVAAPEPAAKQ
jgi:hypothetical protein